MSLNKVQHASHLLLVQPLGRLLDASSSSSIRAHEVNGEQLGSRVRVEFPGGSRLFQFPPERESDLRQQGVLKAGVLFHRQACGIVAGHLLGRASQQVLAQPQMEGVCGCRREALPAHFIGGARSQDQISLMEGERLPGTIRVPLLQTHGSTGKQDQRNVWCGTRHPALKLHGLMEGLRDQVFPTCFLAGEVEERSGQRTARRALRYRLRNHHWFSHGASSLPPSRNMEKQKLWWSQKSRQFLVENKTKHNHSRKLVLSARICFC